MTYPSRLVVVAGTSTAVGKTWVAGGVKSPAADTLPTLLSEAASRIPMLALTAAAPARPTATMDTMVMRRVRPENHPAGFEGCDVVMGFNVRRGRPEVGQTKASVR